MATGDLWLARGEGPEGAIEYRNLLQCCTNEGYSVVAVNRTLTDVVLTAKEVLSQVIQASNFSPVNIELSQNLELSDAPLLSPAAKLQQLSRLTLQISEPRFLQQINDSNKIIGSYDVVAVRALNEKIFHSLCSDYDVPLNLAQYYDILSFDLAEKLPFTLKRNQVYEAIRKGKYFELTYGGVFDASKKRICLTNCINLIRATKGKNLIVSSGVASHIYHRSPVDVCSLLVTLGLKRERAVQCTNVERCVKSARYRRTYKGIVSAVSGEELQQTLQAIQTAKETAVSSSSLSHKNREPRAKPTTVRQAFKSKHLKKLEKLQQKLRDRPVNKQLPPVPN